MRLFAKKPPPLIAEGYSSSALVDVVVRKTIAQRDSGLADVPGAIRLPTLLAVSLAGSRVLDFGGAAGIHYLIAKAAFPNRRFRWAVVETDLMVARAREIQTEDLRFFETVTGAAKWLGPIDLVHSVGALQYTPDPDNTLNVIVSLRAQQILWAKLWPELGLARRNHLQRSMLSENGPGPMPTGIEDAPVTHHISQMTEADFLSAHARYRVVWRDGSGAFLFERR